jgi:hypothetical protein
MEALRPSTLGEILDRTAHLYRSRFLVFLGIGAIPTGVVLACAMGVFLFFAWMGNNAAATSNASVGVISILFLSACGLLLFPLCVAALGLGSGALNHAAAAAFLDENVTIRGAYQLAWKRGWRYIWLLVLQTLILFVAPLVTWVVLIVVLGVVQRMAGMSGNDAGSAIGASMLVFTAVLGAYGIWMLLRLCLAFPACVVEEIAAWAALKRATSLSQDTRGRILVLYLLGAVLGWVLSLLVSFPIMIVVSLIPGANTPQHSQMLGIILLFTMYGSSFAVQAFTKPVYATALLLFYYDQRIRKEGFDIEWMMRQAGMVESSVPEPEAAWMPARPAETEPATKSIPEEGAVFPVRPKTPPGAAESLPLPSPALSSVETADPTPAVHLPPDTEALEQVSGEPA